MKIIGSQIRESLEEAGYTFVSLNDGELVLKDNDNGTLDVWHENDHYAGYVIEYNSKGYEFCHTLKSNKE